jgi:hypothetical protein
MSDMRRRDFITLLGGAAHGGSPRGRSSRHRAGRSSVSLAPQSQAAFLSCVLDKGAPLSASCIERLQTERLE